MPVNPVSESPPISPTWHPNVLKAHFDEKIEDLRRSMADLRVADQTAVSAALAAAEKAVITALASAEKATDKSERDVERWRAASNEWRAAMDDREAKFVAIETFEARVVGLTDQSAARLSGLEHQIAALDSKVDDLTKSRDLNAGRQLATTAIIGFVFAAITIALRFI